MTERIKSGNYVRTESGYIHKISYWDDEFKRYIEVTKEDWFTVYPSNIVKDSENIIDLIEVRRFC